MIALKGVARVGPRRVPAFTKVLPCTRSLKPTSTPIRSLRSDTQQFSRQRTQQLRQKEHVTGQVGAPPRIEPFEPVGSSVGRLVVAGTCLAGLGGLAFYGSGAGADENAPSWLASKDQWPPEVQQRVRDVYKHVGAGLAVTAASAYGMYATGFAHRVLMASPMMTLGVGLGSLFLTMGATMWTPAEQKARKSIFFTLFNVAVAGTISPLCFLGGPLLVRAALITGGAVGGLSLIAATAPNDKFLTMGGPLALGLGGVALASLAGLWLPPTTMAGGIMYSISLYGGVAVFSGLILMDTQRVLEEAKHYNQLAEGQWDSINRSISIYLNIVNLFIRVASIMSNSKKR